jgi:hypothetical protein
MDQQPRDQLCALVSQYGPALGDDPQRCEGLLRDLCTGYKREVHTLASAAREGVPAELLAAKSGAASALVLARLAKRLQDNLGLAEDAARWAVESWALALGVLSAHQLARPAVSARTRPAAPNPAPPAPGRARPAAPHVLEVRPAHEHGHGAVCPFCGGHVQAGAKKCPHCRETLDPALRAVEEARRAAAQSHGIALNQQVHVHGAEARPYHGPQADPGFPHLMHLVLSFLTCGLWLPIYVLHYLFSAKNLPNFLVRLLSTGICLSALTVAGCLTYGLFIGKGIPFLTKTVDRERTSDRLKRIALALRTYQDRHGRLPPAVLQDPGGQPYSWRVAILPFFGDAEKRLYDSYNRKEPWDSPTNRAVLARMPGFYDAGHAPGPDMTFFQVLVGPGTAFEGSQGLVVPGDFPDGAAQTILVVEAAEAVSWTKPVDLPYSPNQPLPRLVGPTGEILVSFADGSSRALPKETPERVLRALITRNGKEVLGPGDLP